MERQAKPVKQFKPTQQKAPWYIRLAQKLGYKPNSKEFKQTRQFTSKRARQTTRPKNFDHRRKVRRKMARASRKINRRMA